MEIHWQLPPHDEQVIQQIERTLKVSPLMAKLLYNREIRTASSANTFMNAPLSELKDPCLLEGVDKASGLICEAIKSERKIWIYGDYDADGMTGTSILVRCIEMLGGKVQYYIPNRLDEGYGLNCESLNKIKKLGAELVITVDCGIASIDEADYAEEIGLDLIITDHHRMASRLPKALAIAHPELPDNPYPFAPLCGAGVAFKVAWATCQKYDESEKVTAEHREFLMQAVGIAAIGTVADVVPLIGENRIIVRHGLFSIKNRPVDGLARLMKYLELTDKPQLASEDIGFAIAPRLNAAGRLGQAQLGVELLVTQDNGRAETLAEYVNNLNVSREKLERSLLTEAKKQIKEQYDPETNPAFVLNGRGWHLGVIGIIAGKLAEQYRRPVVIISCDENGNQKGVGSARSGGMINLYDAFTTCQANLNGFGGHAAAAGLQIDESKIDAFRCDFLEYVASEVPEDKRGGKINIDAQALFDQITVRALQELEKMAPFGNSNPRPVFCTVGVKVINFKRIGKNDRHLSFQLEQHGQKIRGVAFGRGDWFEELEKLDGEIDVAYRPMINEFKGMRRAEIQLVDWRKSRQPTEPVSAVNHA